MAEEKGAFPIRGGFSACPPRNFFVDFSRSWTLGRQMRALEVANVMGGFGFSQITSGLVDGYASESAAFSS